MSKKDRDMRFVRTGPEKYVRRMKLLFIAFTVFMVPAIMVFLVYAFNTEGNYRIIFSVASACAILLFLCVYTFYALQVTLGTVIALQRTDKVVHLTTKRKVFTYDAVMGCVDVKGKRRKFVCTFETQDSRDKFIFYVRAPFSSFSDTQFTEEDIRGFYPRYDDEFGS